MQLWAGSLEAYVGMVLKLLVLVDFKFPFIEGELNISPTTRSLQITFDILSFNVLHRQSYDCSYVICMLMATVSYKLLCFCTYLDSSVLWYSIVLVISLLFVHWVHETLYLHLVLTTSCFW